MLFGLCGAAAVFGLLAALWLEPLSGDLVRVGGYGEHEFGWNGVEEQFFPPLAEPGKPDREYDVVVVGDSFSSRTTPDRQTRYGSFWTDFLANETGLSVGVFDVADTPVEKYIAGPEFHAHPPRLVILEIAERTLRARLAGPTNCPPLVGRAVEARLARVAVPLLAGSYRRPVAPRSIATAVGEMTDYLRKNVLRQVFHQDTTEALLLPLSRPDLFSSRRPGELLVFTDDRRKVDWSDDDWSTIRCRLQGYQTQVTANGVSAFLFMLVPDKSTAYAAFLPAAAWQINAAERLAEPAGLNMPRLDVVLRTAIAAGTRDVYLPNDSHWGTTGSRIAAETVLRYLQQGQPPAPTENGNATASRWGRSTPRSRQTRRPAKIGSGPQPATRWRRQRRSSARRA